MSSKPTQKALQIPVTCPGCHGRAVVTISVELTHFIPAPETEHGMPRGPSIEEQIIEEICEAYFVTLAEVRSPKPLRRLSLTRWVVTYAFWHADYSLIQIAKEHMLNKDHTSPGYGLRKAQDLALINPEFNALLYEVREYVRRRLAGEPAHALTRRRLDDEFPQHLAHRGPK